jgi:hypothetical protein
MAGLLDWQDDEQRAAQQRALMSYAGEVARQQDRQAVFDALGQTWPAQIMKSLFSGATLAGDVAYGKVDPRSPEAINRAADFAGGVMLGGMPLGHQAAKQAAAEGSALIGMFAGPSAKTADLDALKMAQELAKGGASREDIWNKTGWFQGADKKWRFEIDDTASRITDKVYNDVIKEGSYYGALSPAFEHPELYRAYPSLSGANATLHAKRDPGGAYTQLYGGGHSIEAFGPSTTAQRSVVLHEGQHGIQNIEGFSRGGSPEGGLLNYDAPKVRALQQEQAKVQEQLAKTKYGSDEFDRLLNKSYDLERQMEKEAAFAGYRELAGEAEARNVQTRRNMTPEERRATPPWTTSDIPFEKQRVLLDPPGTGVAYRPNKKRITREDIERGLL